MYYLEPFWDIISYIPKFKDAPTTPSQETICCPNTNVSQGEPLYKIWIL